MEKPKLENKEEISPQKQEILDLEKAGIYLFHGSPNYVEGNFEPHQAFERGEKDGNPKISATPSGELAIFRSMINPKNFNFKEYGTIFGISKETDTPILRATQKVLDELGSKEDLVGYVYVFNKKDFIARGDGKYEWYCESRVEPIKMIVVHKSDLFKEIELKE